MKRGYTDSNKSEGREKAFWKGGKKPGTAITNKEENWKTELLLGAIPKTIGKLETFGLFDVYKKGAE